MTYDLTAFAPDQRVELHPACDLWMRGARYGTIAAVGRTSLTVFIDRLGRCVKMAPRMIGAIL